MDGRVTNKDILSVVTEVKALATTNALAVTSLRNDFQDSFDSLDGRLGALNKQFGELDKRLVRQETISNERKGHNLPIAATGNSRLNDPKIFLAVMGVMNGAFGALIIALQIIQARGG